MVEDLTIINQESIIQFNDTDDDWMQLLHDISDCDDDAISNDKINSIISSIKNGSIKNYFATNHIDLENNLVLDINSDKSLTSNVCPKCKLEYSMNYNSYICKSCGLETSWIDETVVNFSSEKDHNTSNNSYMTFNFVGKNSYRYQRSFLKTCSNYASFRRNTNNKELNNSNYQYEGKKIPKTSIKLAVELFSTIKDNKNVYRGNGKKGVLGACLFYACVMDNITKTPREIANIMGIEERFLSTGDRKVQELNEKGIISIPTLLRPLSDYIDQYFPALNIPIIYKTFIMDIIDRTELKNIHIKNDSRTTTKAIGAIYLLVTRLPSLKHITKDVIVVECNISKSTFIRYYNLLITNWIAIKPVFKKHKISMPTAWRV